jgi:DNA-damage-inducible protein D
MSSNLTTFEQIKHSENQIEYWLARELMPYLGYARFDSFKRIIQKVIQEVETDKGSFHKDVELLKIDENNPNPKEDYSLSRFACYKIAMLGSTSECIQARTYFATQTRRQELLQEEENNQKRIENRAKLTENRNGLRDEVYTRGVDDTSKFAGLEDNINLGLYTKRTKAIKKHKGIPENKPLDNYTSNVELLAKSLSMEMTKINVNQKNLLGIEPIYSEGKENASEIRKSLLVRGIEPESLPAETDIEKLKAGKSLTSKNSNSKKLK